MRITEADTQQTAADHHKLNSFITTDETIAKRMGQNT